MAIPTRPDAPGDGYDGVRSPWDGQRMSLEAFRGLPEQKPALEYLEGIVRQKMAAKPIHGVIQGTLAEEINRFARPRRLGVALPEVRFTTDQWSPVPDVAFYRRESLTERRPPADFTIPPDLAIEVLSPGQTVTALLQTCLDNLARGTTVALLVHPAEETVFALRAGDRLQLLKGDARIDVDEVLPGFQLSVRELFESANWNWLDQPPEIQIEARAAQAQAGEGAQADDAAASERSGG